MSQDAAQVVEKLMASEEARRAYDSDPIFRQVIDAVRARVAEGGDPLVAIGQALALLSEGKRKETDREAVRRLGSMRSTLRPWWS
jgi:hypothetical protein